MFIQIKLLIIKFLIMLSDCRMRIGLWFLDAYFQVYSMVKQLLKRLFIGKFQFVCLLNNFY
jgi:hypothetical protein